ncbi:Putative AC9 transposase, partial [Fusarium oxysporum f. sp. cubense race 1]
QATLRNCLNKQAYIEAVVGLPTRRRLPFSAVEYSELRDLALACNPAIGGLLINDRKQAMGYINSNYSLYSSQLAESLQTTQSKIHISSDLWTSPHHHGVLAVCVQWVDEDFKLQKALLGLPECKYSHSGATQAGLIAGTLRKFNITAQNLGCYVGDNATSNDTRLEELSKILEVESGAEYPHKRRRIRCIGHIINLALQAFLLARSKAALRAALEATADEPALHNHQWYDAVGKQLGIDNITRWSSWHRVITIALNKKP